MSTLIFGGGFLGERLARELPDAVLSKVNITDRDAVDVFAQNLRALLLAAPLGGKAVIGIDPGQRTGCKTALSERAGTGCADVLVQHGDRVPFGRYALEVRETPGNPAYAARKRVVEFLKERLG